jgi:hypothetical protein
MFDKKKESGVSASTRPSYAVPGDFCRIFAEDKNALYLLSLLLTADSEKAEQCFVAGLEDSIHGNPVFKEWARSWSKRTIIKNAIRMISPAPGQMSGVQPLSDKQILASDFDGLLTAVLQLAPLERFVYVMSILEGYSIQECSILLSCTKQEVTASQEHAVQQLAIACLNRLAPLVPGAEGARAAHFLEPVQVA